jgi:hypothetical protein
MSAINPAELELLRQTAELRADGLRWPEVAVELATDLGQLRILATQHARTFGSLLRHAKREAWHDTMNDSFKGLRKLLKSSNDETVMAVGLAFLKYDLGKMRRETQVERERVQARSRRHRDELPPPPGWRGTAESTRCDSVKPEPEVPEREEVIEKSTVVQNARCDSVTVTSDRMTCEPAKVENRPPAQPATPTTPATATLLTATNWQIPIMGANRRRKWIPFDLRMVKAPPVAPIEVKKDRDKPPHIFDGRLTAILGA